MKSSTILNREYQHAFSNRTFNVGTVSGQLILVVVSFAIVRCRSIEDSETEQQLVKLHM
jgi:hypothetical protein